jgi:hypothetical protein
MDEFISENIRVETLFESKKTELEAINVLSNSNITDNVESIVSSFKEFDTTKNQILLPIIARAYIENKMNINKDMESLFVSISRLYNEGKIKTPMLNPKGGYIIGDKTFPTYIKLSEYIHGLESMSRGYSNWKGAINVDVDEPPIWNKNGIKIYDGNDVGKCIKYTTGSLTGQRYGFCIGQPANTMWQSYRDDKTSTFYFVIDESRNLSDPLHIVVVDNTAYGIELTDRDNTTGSIAEYGHDTDGYMNYLRNKGVPVDKLIVNIPKTPEEEAEQEKLGSSNGDLNWFKKLTFQEKSKYVGRGHLLSDEQFNYLWHFKNDKGGYHLLHQYLDTGQAIPESQFNVLIK